VFQFEGDYAFSLLKDFKPNFINDMSLVNAALRPSGKSYRDKLIAKTFNTNPSNQIDDLLKENYGYLVYQEDTIKFLTDICGFSGSLADTTRRAIGKKDIELLNAQLPKILEGYCEKSTKPREVAEQEAKQFIKIIEDSSEYQFGYNHSTAYSMNGYACVRLRTHYPIEFVTAYLNRSENTEDTINGVNLAKELKIEVKPIEFGKSLSEYAFDKNTNTIYKGIASIKWCNSQIAEELYDLSLEKEYDNFIDLLADIKSKTSINSRQLKILTGLNFFRRFGKNKKLLNSIDMFENLAHRKQINHKQIQELNIDINVLAKNSKKITEKVFKELDMISYIKESVGKIEDKPLSIKEQVEFEITYLEYTIYTNEKAGKNFYIITEYTTYKDKTKPYVTLRHIKTGEDLRTKIKDSKIFTSNPFKLYDILKVNEFKIQKKTKCIGGVWQKTNEDEKILYDYEVY
jgi:DNA polymerase-3 subunit alpha